MVSMRAYQKVWEVGRKRVSAEAYVEKEMHDPVQRQWAYQIWFKDSSSAEHRVNVLCEDIAKADFCKSLRQRGLKISPITIARTCLNLIF